MSKENAIKLFAAGSIGLGLVFVWTAVNNFLTWDALVGYAQFRNVPAANILAPLAQLGLLVSGVSLATGIAPRWGLGIFIVFLVGVTIFMHPWWSLTAGTERDTEYRFFMLNVMLFFSSLTALAFAFLYEWPYSLRKPSAD